MREHGCGLLGRVALADAAEVELEAGLELDVVPEDPDVAATGRRSTPTVLRRQKLEGTVVARRHEGLVDGGIEPAAGPLTRLEGELGYLHQVRRRVDRAITIQPRQLRVSAKTGEQLFEPVEFRLGFDQSCV